MYNKLLSCVNDVRKITSFKPLIAIVLGSGLGDFADTVEVEAIVNYSDIRDFPQSTVQGHKGRFVFGYVSGVPVVLMQGRVHFYEGYSMQDVVLPIRVMRLLGAQNLILTNAAGGINSDFIPGDLMMITDHISAFIPNPLIGKNIDELGTRFPDMSCIYDKSIQDIIINSAKKCNINLKHGIYTQLSGPSYESPSEIKMLRTLGSDAVGMSTVCEAIAAIHCGFKVGAISCITNMAAGILNQKLDHSEVQKTADSISYNFQKLLTNIITELGELNV